MSTVSDVVAETGLDLADPKLIERALAPQLQARMATAFPVFNEIKGTISNIMTAYKGMAASTTVLGAVGIAVAAIGAASSYLEGRMDKSASDNRKRWEKARNLTISTWVRPGDWSSVVYASGPPPNKVDIKNSAFGWTEAQFLAQYSAGTTWMCHRSMRSDVMMPSWDIGVFSAGYGIMPKDVLAETGVLTPQWSPLTGFTYTSRYHRLQQAQVAPIPSKYYDYYSGHLPTASLQDINDSYIEKGLLGITKLLSAMEAGGFFEHGFVPPPDYSWLFSVGTYPHVGWWGGCENNTSMAAIAAGIHSLTPLHTAIRYDEVARCYKQWLQCSRIRLLPRIPKGQVETGVYLDDDDLPWSPSPYLGILCVQPQTPAMKAAEEAARKNWDYQGYKDNLARCAADPSLANINGSMCFPEGLTGSGMIPWMVARDIEMSFRSFFRVRRAALFQMSLASDSFRSAAAKSPDAILAAAAAGKAPSYSTWHPHDPLSDGWLKPASNGGGAHAGQSGFGIKGPEPTGPVVNPNLGFGGNGKLGTEKADDGGGLLLAGGAAAAAAVWLFTRKSKRP